VRRKIRSRTAATRASFFSRPSTEVGGQKTPVFAACGVTGAGTAMRTELRVLVSTIIDRPRVFDMDHRC
jgi:hypothetical protein